MKIGILSKNYAAKRLFLDKIPEAQYKDIRFYNYYLWRNAHLWFLRAIGKLNMTPEEQASKLFYDFKALFPTGCDLFHFFNTINFSEKTPWVVSVESGVPWPLNVIRCVESADADLSSIKTDRYIEKCMHYLSLPNCKGLLALSECSQRIQFEIIKQFPQYEYQIRQKLITLSPPQELLVRSVQEKNISYNAPITFIFIGRDYFRKGGRETVQVLSKLHKKYDFRLILISDLRVDEPKYFRTNHDIEDAKTLINANLDWIEYHAFLPNEKVLEKIKSSHVALLPTWMDTYGYSLLECQACGTPVITTSLRALTETNRSECGWLVDVPVNKLNNPIHNTVEERNRFSDQLLNGLENCLEEILEHPEQISLKAKSCIDYIRENHNPKNYRDKLNLVYNDRISELI